MRPANALCMLISTAATLALIVAALAGCSGPQNTNTAWTTVQTSGWHHYGHDVEPYAGPVAFSALKDGDYTTVEPGTITDVCAKKGCWMRVQNDAGQEMFVRFQDYSFFVPRNAMGHRVVMHGTAVKQMMSVEELRHYAEDAGKSEAEIAAITEPQEQMMFFADSVYIEGEGLDAPHVQ